MGSMLSLNNNLFSQNLINRPSRGVPQIFSGTTEDPHKSIDPKMATVRVFNSKMRSTRLEEIAKTSEASTHHSTRALFMTTWIAQHPHRAAEVKNHNR
ncbi:unnamed protein product [Ceutorhynchus assimilis]|uniref:Uncharacterized protein n=1 Tax=Ceutorhynchus assimilis TaxID=467358 RepID=A0A9N9MFC1_9CUCU|nr:unnamed protein product [Ceutorhynchus assimilis]